MNRRDFHLALATGLFSGALAAAAHAQQQPGSAARLQIGALVYSNMILLDLVGPQTIFNIMGADVHLVGVTKAPVATDVGVPLAPTMSLEECPANLDVLFVPGGLAGTVAVMDNQAAMDFLADRGSRARYVTSVCTGSLALAAAGLLKGYKATSHWYVRDLLPAMGAETVHERVVVDRNRITGAGVTAGLDMGLEVARIVRGDDTAKFIQLLLEYDSKPPLDAGSPERAGAGLANDVLQRRAPAIDAARAAAARAAQRLHG